MIQEYIDRFQKNKTNLYYYFAETPQSEYGTYEQLLTKTIEMCINDPVSPEINTDAITQINDGDYQGTLLFVIPLSTYQPCEWEYLTTYVGYGSCSGCDTLLGISEYDTGLPNKTQIEAYLTLCLHMVEHMEWFRESPYAATKKLTDSQTESNDINLKPCPFCGTAPTTRIDYVRCGDGKLEMEFAVVCPECRTIKRVIKEVSGVQFEEYNIAMKEAEKLWNQRI